MSFSFTPFDREDAQAIDLINATDESYRFIPFDSNAFQEDDRFIRRSSMFLSDAQLHFTSSKSNIRIIIVS